MKKLIYKSLLFVFIFNIFSVAVYSLENNVKKPNIILISIDSLRPDHLKCYGYFRNTSPNIDGLANDGVMFTDSVSTTTWTLPAHISMLTSLYPEAHQVIHDGVRLSEKATVCSEILQTAGYVNAGFVSGPYLHSRFGYNQGFDIYDDYTINFSSNEEAHRGITSPRIHKRISSWLEQNYKQPFFLFLHYWDVHYDYIPPAPFDTMFDKYYKGDISSRNFEHNWRINPSMPKRDLEHIIALYDGEIAFTDSYIGKLLRMLKELGIYDNTMIIFTADHGDEFFEHGEKGHRKNLFDTTLKVPLIIKFPNNRWAGHQVEHQAGIVDIVPTFLDYLDINPKVILQGKSLLPLITEEKQEDKSYYFADLHGNPKCVRTGQYKYIIFWERRSFFWNRKHPSLFDLSNDAEEQNNIAESNSEVKDRLHEVLMDSVDSSRIIAGNIGKSQAQYSEDFVKKLKDLGYIK